MELDTEVRLAIYDSFVGDRRSPTVAECAEAIGAGEVEVAEAYRRLEADRVIVLAPGTLNIWMANPLSAVPTPFRVETPRGAYWGNCIWDALGVIAMLGGEGEVATDCADCSEPMRIFVTRGKLAAGDGVAHFAVPAARWWDNIGFT
jgi:Alkylmercury lyase